MEATDAKVLLKLLRFIMKGTVTCCPAASGNSVLLDGGERGIVSFDRKLVDDLLRRGLLAESNGGLLVTAAGTALAASLSQAADQMVGPARHIEAASLDEADGPIIVARNACESPLAHLHRRKSKEGKPFLTSAEFAAGERLRQDYTRGQLMPRLGANWVASVASGKRGGGSAGGMIDLTDAALASRQCVDRAIKAVGPELSGVLIDVCCFLKGLELVETERGWPVRSAKIVLKTALGALSRHYDPRSAGRATPRMLHWGADDYRPRVE